MPTVAEYAVDRLARLGIRHVFGLPGDFAFPIDDAVEEHPDLTWVVSTNELNAAYSADGYARIHGCAILSTTYGVGELSALNGVMGSKAENLPVFHLVGGPAVRLARTKRHLHHTLGDGEVGNFIPLSAASTCGWTALTPDNAVAEMERLISHAFKEMQPAYIYIPQDIAMMHVLDPEVPIATTLKPRSCLKELGSAVNSILQRIRSAKTLVVLVSYKVGRYNLTDKVQQLIEKLDCPFTATTMDRQTLPETHPQFLGLYRGAVSPPGVIETVEGADLVLNVGGCIFDDLSTGFATTNLSSDRLVTLGIHFVEIVHSSSKVQMEQHSYDPVWLEDVLDALLEIDSLPSFSSEHFPSPVLPEAPLSNMSLTYPSVLSILARFFQDGDIIVCETGTISVQMAGLTIPEGCTYMNQTLWGSIGWATPAALGVALAAPKRRVILITGDGSHQVTATELGVMGRYDVNVVCIVLNNGMYGIEAFLEKNKVVSYNDLALWEYSKIPPAMGCFTWRCCKVETNGEFEKELEEARRRLSSTYIEVVLGEKLLKPLGSFQLNHQYMVKPFTQE
uniref:pyruvate decarboxylase n=1 Tax=Picocystis salinarum TaxID=88271 RepID=A0A7S3U9G5_9CHLO|mmetsp:Transcript_1566/g.9642  ORF Transcript_1566/g.9642 Transcript_1566/m.9642 type:complete len:564 (-) Transcript_1566:2854-4545(-)